MTVADILMQADVLTVCTPLCNRRVQFMRHNLDHGQASTCGVQISRVVVTVLLIASASVFPSHAFGENEVKEKALPADSPRNANNSPGPTGVQIEQAFKALDSDEWTSREKAMQTLSQAGAIAVDRLRVIADRGSAEASWRAVEILIKLAVSNDITTEREAERALTVLLDSERRSVAVAAEKAGKHLVEKREAHAMQRLVELGARYSQQFASLKFDSNWKGSDEDLKYVRRLRTAGLASISIEATSGIKDDGVKTLKTSLKGSAILIHVFGKAFLGMGGIPNTYHGGLQVHSVVPASGADVSGVKVGDVVTYVDDKRVKVFDDLNNIIRAKKAGDTVVLKIIRGTTKVTCKAKLGKRPALDN
jgi:hypothetical protein